MTNREGALADLEFELEVLSNYKMREVAAAGDTEAQRARVERRRLALLEATHECGGDSAAS